ncbi:MAG: YggS family pyridoxal phosphate-dependent enzyme [Specibacter sp.]
MNTPDSRALTLEANLAAVRDRIAKAAGAAVPTLIVVTKFHPAADVRRLRQLGVADVGENRDQEAAAKAHDVADPALRWHFIGQLQKNKAKSVVHYAHSVHSIDRSSLVGALGRAMAAQQDLNGRAALECFIQVDLSGDADPAGVSGEPGARGGAAPSDVGMLADLVAGAAGLKLAGVMAVAPLDAEPSAAFERLAEISAALVHNHPGAAAISAGMSHDLEAAIRAGATHLRVGSDILGPRPAVG